MLPPPPRSTLFPYTTLFRSLHLLFVPNDADGTPDVARATPLDFTVSGIALFDDQVVPANRQNAAPRSEEHTSELQSRFDLVCRLLLEKKNNREKAHPRLRST